MANSYLTRTPSSTGNRRKFTFSAWVKFNFNQLENNSRIFSCGSATSAWVSAYINANGTLQLAIVEGGNTYDILTNRLFRDESAWYHLVFVVDTENTTANNRLRMYVNGEEETSFSQRNNPTKDLDTQANTASKPIDIGSAENVGYSPRYFPGYMSHVAMVDGQVLTPTSFGETDSTSGIWKFKGPSGLSWGTNGFHLKFENSGALGTDSSGQSNNFTVNGDVKQSLDTPSNVHSVWNVRNPTLPPTIRYGNTEIYTNANSWKSAFTTLGASSGKWYMEMKWGGGSHLTPGFATMDVPGHNPTYADIINNPSNGGYAISLYTNGIIYENGSNEGAYGSGTSFSVNDIIMLAMDLDNNKLYWGKNGTWFNSANPAGNTGGYSINASYTSSTFGFAISVYNTTAQCNFGDGFFGTTAIGSAGSNGNGSLFEYDVPSGFYALNTNNINTYG